MAATFHATGDAEQHSAASFSIVTTISAGDGVVVFGSWDSASVTTPTVVTTGGAGSDSLTLIYGASTSGPWKYAAWLLQSASAARTGVTLTWASSNPAFADAYCQSFSGLTNPTLDGSGFRTGAIAGAFSSVDTATLQSADEFAIGYAASTFIVGTADAPWTDDTTTTSTGSWGEHRILAATTAVHTNFSQGGSTPTYITFCLTFMAAPVVASFTGYVFGVGQRSQAPTTRMIGY